MNGLEVTFVEMLMAQKYLMLALNLGIVSGHRQDPSTNVSWFCPTCCQPMATCGDCGVGLSRCVSKEELQGIKSALEVGIERSNQKPEFRMIEYSTQRQLSPPSHRR